MLPSAGGGYAGLDRRSTCELRPSPTCGCAGPPHVPVGRNADTTPPITCPSGNASEQVLVSYSPPELDPGSLSIDNGPRQACILTGVVACHVGMYGPPGSIASFCRDSGGTISGAVRLVAPDASIVEEGSCDQSLATGAWFVWAGGHLAWAVAYDRGVKRGMEIELNEYDHRFTGRYHGAR